MGPFKAKHTLAWDAVTKDTSGNPVTGIKYKVYWRNSQIGYNNQDMLDAGLAVTLDLNLFSLAPGAYFVAATAYNAAGDESVLSSEIPFDNTLPASPGNLHIA